MYNIKNISKTVVVGLYPNESKKVFEIDSHMKKLQKQHLLRIEEIKRTEKKKPTIVEENNLKEEVKE